MSLVRVTSNKRAARLAAARESYAVLVRELRRMPAETKFEMFEAVESPRKMLAFALTAQSEYPEIGGALRAAAIAEMGAER